MVASSTSAGRPGTRGLLRILTTALVAVVAALYLAVFPVQVPHLHETDNPAPLYAFLAVVYLAGAVLVALRDTRPVLLLGLIAQALLLGGFTWLLVLLIREGDQAFLTDMLGLVIAVTAGQVVLLGLFAYLLAGAPRRGAQP